MKRTLLWSLWFLDQRAARAYSTISGRRCLLQECETSKGPPLLLLGGTAQTIASWEYHVPQLSKNRAVLVYECLGQGPEPASDLSNVSLPAQVELLEKTLCEAFPSHDSFDIVGFSMGARLAMAFSIMYPQRIRKLHLTGVGVEPTEAGLVALESWKCLLGAGNMQGFGWSILHATYSPSFLHRNLPKLSQWVRFIEANNSPHGLLALLQQTRQNGWSPLEMASRMNKFDGCLIVGELDLMASSTQVLADKLDWGSVHIVPECGHAVPTERPTFWRKHVLDFLSS